METCRSEYNTTSARQSKLGATPAAQVSARVTDSYLFKQGTKVLPQQSLQQEIFTPSGSSQSTRQPASPGTRDPSKDDSSELSSQAPRLQGDFPRACPKTTLSLPTEALGHHIRKTVCGANTQPTVETFVWHQLVERVGRPRSQNLRDASCTRTCEDKITFSTLSFKNLRNCKIHNKFVFLLLHVFL